MQTADFESDAFLKLLTDALRRGPGSPAWREAVVKVRELGPGAENDEMKLLVLAREHLASGQSYRTIRAGPNFTSELMGKLDVEQSGDDAARKPRMTTWVLAVSGLLIFVALAFGVWRFVKTEKADGDPSEPLRSAYFVKPVNEVSFNDAALKALSAGGPLELESRQGVRIDGKTPFAESASEVLWLRDALPPGAAAADLQLEVRKGSDQVIIQFFVTDQPAFTGSTMASPSELAWLLQGSTAKVLTRDGRITAQAAVAKRGVSVRLRLNEKQAVIECDGQIMWSGPHGLRGARYVGVRFTRVGSDTGDVRVKSLSVLTS